MASDTKAKSSKRSFWFLLVAVITTAVITYLWVSTRASNSPHLNPPPNMRRPDRKTGHAHWVEDAQTLHAHPPSKPKPVPTREPTLSEQALAAHEKAQRGVVSAIKARRVVMEKNPEALQETGKLQAITRQLILARYGQHAKTTSKGTVFHIQLTVSFPEVMPDMDARGPTGVITVETAPIELMPHAVFLFLELVTHWDGGAFHRNAGHVLQVMTHGSHLGLAFQEYSPKYPHIKYTLGYAGRPGGPPFYVSTVDNTHNHGPASQGSKSEADSCFGRVLEGKDVVDRLLNVWGVPRNGFSVEGGNGFLQDHEQFAQLKPKLL